MAPDWYWDGRKARPIRGTPGYEDAFVGLSEKDKDYLREQWAESNTGRRGYTHTANRSERQARVDEAKTIPKTKARGLSPSAQDARFTRKHKSRLY